MDRLAIIIKGYSKNDRELKADQYFVQKYVEFLQLTAGGAWDFEHEIIVIEDPTIESLIKIAEKQSPHFILLIMIGHGATQDSKQLFQINKTDIIQAGQLAFDVEKQLVILESCRTHHESKIKSVNLKGRVPAFKKGGKIRRPLSKEEARKIYIDSVEACPKGLVVCYPCSENENASEYFFSSAVILKSFKWHLNNYNKCLSISELMDLVSREVNIITNGEQMPIISGAIEFPFAVSKF